MLIRLGIVGALHQTLHSTNPIENLQGSIRRVTCRVKRWRGGFMAPRWTASALLEAEKSSRRVKDHREIPQLVAALEATLGEKAVDREAQIASIVNPEHRRLSTTDGTTPLFQFVALTCSSKMLASGGDPPGILGQPEAVQPVGSERLYLRTPR